MIGKNFNVIHRLQAESETLSPNLVSMHENRVKATAAPGAKLCSGGIWWAKHSTPICRESS